VESLFVTEAVRNALLAASHKAEAKISGVANPGQVYQAKPKQELLAAG